MLKRGQVTVFIILGIIIVAVIALVLYARNTGFSPFNLITGKELSIRDEVKKCVVEIAEPDLDTLGKQGGSFDPKLFRLYQGYPVNYLCYNKEDTSVCSSRVFRLQDLESEIEDNLANKIKVCIDSRFDALKSEGISIQTRDYSLEVSIAQDNVLLLVNYPTSIIKNGNADDIETYVEVIDVPLGKLYAASDVILQGESLIGDFDPVPYMVLHKDIEIQKLRPYPDKIYIINEVNDDYIFQFAIQGEPR